MPAPDRDQYLFLVLAQGLVRETGLSVRIVEGDAWSYNPAAGEVKIPASGLNRLGREVCFGLLAHEVGHRLFTRYHQFDLTSIGLPKELAWLVLNGLEDPRSDRAMRYRYPGVGRWMAKADRVMRSPKVPGSMPRVMGFVLGCVLDQDVDRPAMMPEGVDASVATALVETREARRQYIACQPRDWLQPDADRQRLERRYREAVQPELLSPWREDEPDAEEMAVRVAAWEAFSIARASVFPQVVKLWQEEYGEQLELLRLLLEAIRKRLAGDDCGRLSDALQQLLNQLPYFPWMPSMLRQGMAEIGALDGDRKQLSEEEHLRSRIEDWRRLRREIEPQIRSLQHELRHLLRIEQHTRRGGGFSSGRQVDLRRLMQSRARPLEKTRLWQRPVMPQPGHKAVSLLVDLSGSMSHGSKGRAAVAATLLLAESLSSVGIDFEINGFQDRLIPFVPFGARLDDSRRAEIASMQEEIYSIRDGGNNCSQWNDDGPCLEKAARHLDRHPARRKLLIVLCDGGPSGRTSGPEELLAAVARVRALPNIELVALGIGDGTREVADFYPVAETEIPVEAVGERVVGVLRRLVAAT